MEVTLLVEATENAFRILGDARKHAEGIIDSALELTSEETRHHEAKRIQEIFTGAQKRKTEFQNFIGTAVILYAFWILLSGQFDAFHLTLGAICCIVVAYLYHDLLFANTTCATPIFFSSLRISSSVGRLAFSESSTGDR